MRRSEPGGPVAVGGLGGSGTRVVAGILRRLGIYLGADLNANADNLWFTLLFKRPHWLAARTGARRAEVFPGLALFEKAMTGQGRWSAHEHAFVWRAALDLARSGHNHLGDGRGLWPFRRALSLYRAPRPGPSFVTWGWKEPNTHVLLELLAEHFAGLRYIHVVRHGLDMAFSRNQTQLHLWGPLFGVVPDEGSSPGQALRFWISANEAALERGRRLLGERFLLLDFDRLCDSPGREIDRLVAFLGIEPSAAVRADLCGLPRRPASSGRHRLHGLHGFTEDDLVAVQRFGYDVPERARGSRPS